MVSLFWLAEVVWRELVWTWEGWALILEERQEMAWCNFEVVCFLTGSTYLLAWAWGLVATTEETVWEMRGEIWARTWATREEDNWPEDTDDWPEDREGWPNDREEDWPEEREEDWPEESKEDWPDEREEDWPEDREEVWPATAEETV